LKRKAANYNYLILYVTPVTSCKNVSIAIVKIIAAVGKFHILNTSFFDHVSSDETNRIGDGIPHCKTPVSMNPFRPDITKR
jgi:hypothetical protein